MFPFRISLMVQWLTLCPSNAVGTDLILGWGSSTAIPWGKKKRENSDLIQLACS